MSKDQKINKHLKHNPDAFFASCPKGLEGLLEQELKDLGIDDCRQTIAGVYFSDSGTEAGIIASYKACLWSRLANKVLMPLDRINAKSAEDIYNAVKALPWEHFLSSDGDMVVDFIGTDKVINNSQFGALKIKDAIVDRIREQSGERPSINKQNPDVRINARLSRGTITLSLDMSGDSLHRRGYRLQQGAAPLKENLAAAVLIRAGWPQLLAQAKQQGNVAQLALLDPMCGSGTFLIEAAFFAADIAPGLARPSFGFETWLNFRRDLWLPLREEALERKRLASLQAMPLISGSDIDSGVLRAAQSNINRAGLSQLISISCKPVLEFSKPELKDSELSNGLIICNPPYGERLGELEQLSTLYRQLGDRMKQEFLGWQGAVFTGEPQLGKSMGLKASKRYKLFNGTIPSELLCFEMQETQFINAPPKPIEDKQAITKLREEDLSEGAVMVLNRIRKNLKPLRKWLKTADTDCYRVYDADIPEYSAAVDVYADALHIQEYRAPKTVDEDKAEVRFNDLVNGAMVALEADPEKVFTKQRQRQRGKDQYQRQERNEDQRDSVFWVREGQASLKVKLADYLDSGVFLDHRLVRKMIGARVAGKTFLNLFCYTATATVQAALAGARSSVSVDMSNTYLSWAEDNLKQNRINGARHTLQRQDCFDYLKSCREGFDVILMDPPSFSNSKKMEKVLDIQRDHVELIHRCMELLNPGGQLFFSNNLRSFKLDEESLAVYQVKNISTETIDKDFQRNQRIHQCWLLQSTATTQAAPKRERKDKLTTAAPSKPDTPWSNSKIKRR